MAPPTRTGAGRIAGIGRSAEHRPLILSAQRRPDPPRSRAEPRLPASAGTDISVVARTGRAAAPHGYQAPARRGTAA